LEVNGRKVKAFADAAQLDKAASLVRKMQGASLSEVHFRACSVGAGNALGALVGFARHGVPKAREQLDCQGNAGSFGPRSSS